MLALAAPAAAQSTDPFQPVGFTSTTHQGDVGVLGATMACIADFGNGARMCTSVEIMEMIMESHADAAAASLRRGVGEARVPAFRWLMRRFRCAGKHLM